MLFRSRRVDDPPTHIVARVVSLDRVSGHVVDLLFDESLGQLSCQADEQAVMPVKQRVVQPSIGETPVK